MKKRLGELDKNLVEYSDDSLHLIEDSTEGKADLELKLQMPCILFKHLEDKKLQYFLIEKCADFVVLEYKNDDWFVHIFEMKRTIRPKSWETIKEQFAGAILNALALTGIFSIGLHLSNVMVYSCYRNDKIDDSTNPAKQRLRMTDVTERSSETQMSASDTDWNEEFLLIPLSQDTVRCHHQKIKLDVETGKGNFTLSAN
ncbi:MAG: hypothetical protein LUH20_01955 [Lachnospiraceae bacterium]|nr:hypothetical protein [Lachnospiraceae bacterium]